MAEDNGTSFTIDLPVKGANEVEAASKALDVLAARLDESKNAYGVAERSANAAAKAVERIAVAAAMASGSKAEALNQRMAEAATKAEIFKNKLNEQATALDKVQKKYDEGKKKLDDLKNKTTEVGKAGEHLDIFEHLERPLRKLGGPLAEVSEGFVRGGAGIAKLVKSMGALGAIVAATVLVVAFSAAIFEATKRVVEFAVELGNERRSAELMAQGIARSVEGGTALNEKIEELNRKLPLSQEELSETAKRLADAGLRGKDLTNALQTSAIAAAKLKFGPNFQREMLSLNQQSKIFHANIAGLFGGLNIEKALTGLQRLIALFDENTASGRAIKAVFESIFGPLVDGLDDASVKIEAFILQVEIMGMKALIAIKPFGSTIVTLIEILMGGAALIIGVVVVAFGLMAAAIGVALVLLGGVVLAAIDLFKILKFLGEGIGDFAFKIVNYIKDVGPAIIEGLVNGIKSGASAVFDALKSVVTGAVDGVKKFLGIASPSKVMEAEVGLQIGAGTERGITRSAPGVRNALEDMVEPPSGREMATAPAAAPTPTNSTSLSGLVFNLYGVKDAEDAEARIGALLTRLLEGDATTLGGAVPSNA